MSISPDLCHVLSELIGKALFLVLKNTVFQTCHFLLPFLFLFNMQGSHDRAESDAQ